MVNIALPSIGRDLGADFGTLQWIVNADTLTLAALILLAGALRDHFGRRRFSPRVVEVAEVLVEGERRLLLVVDQDPIGARLAGATNESFGVAVRRGVRGGILTVWMFSAAKTTSRLVNLVSLSRRHCCIKAKGVLASHQNGEADPSATLDNRNRPGIRTPAAWLLGEQVGQVGWVDRLMQQCHRTAAR